MAGRTVWVHRIPVNALTASFTSTLLLPAGSRLVHVREQRNDVALWFEVPDPEARKEQRGFQLFGTGTGPIRDGLEYVGTCQFADGSLVLHVYEVVT